MKALFIVFCLLNVLLVQALTHYSDQLEPYLNYLPLFVFSQFFLLNGCYEIAVKDGELIRDRQASAIEQLNSRLVEEERLKEKALSKQRKAQVRLQTAMRRLRSKASDKDCPSIDLTY
jgi:hypothetical protein